MRHLATVRYGMVVYLLIIFSSSSARRCLASLPCKKTATECELSPG